MIDLNSISTTCTRTEFVGTTILDTIGLVISGIDDTLLEKMNARHRISRDRSIQLPYRCSRPGDGDG
ncbi:MAG: hypothetical protein ACLTSZ_08720 [Lachnospiraceae bacterium]